jgi:ABC-type branched-subunit amino acid transport system permease subunit
MVQGLFIIGSFAPIFLLAVGAYEFVYLEQSQTYVGHTSNVVFALLITTIVCGIVGYLPVHWHFRGTDPGIWIQMAMIVVPAAIHLAFREQRKGNTFRTMDIIDMSFGAFVLCCGSTYIEKRLNQQEEPGSIV